MNREFKFRAYEFGNMYYQVRVGGVFDGIATSPTTWNGQDWVNLTGGEYTKVMQYTGVKDKNNKEIYEGDIIQITYAHDKSVHKFEVYYDYENAYYSLNEINFDNLEVLCGWSKNQIEVLGNIYQKPELLENQPSIYS